MRNRIQIARGTNTDFSNSTSNVVVPTGVPLYNTTDKKLYVGDGTKTAKQLYNAGGITVTQAESATIAQYASLDTSKGTIEERLTNLGFRQGSVSLNSGYTASKNVLTRQGNYVIGELSLNGSISISNITDVGSTEYVIGTVPEEFKLKVSAYGKSQGAYCRVIVEFPNPNGETSSVNVTNAVSISVRQNRDVVLVCEYSGPPNVSRINSYNLFLSYIHIYFGYEAEPITS